MEKELHLSAALAHFQLSVFCFLLSVFFSFLAFHAGLVR
jgi:hypothetical protein